MGDALIVLSKFILAVLLFPIAWASANIFYQHMVNLPGPHHEFFFWGMLGYLLLFVFFYRFEGVYGFGQRLVSGALQFAYPANNFIARVIPFYLTLILLGYAATVNFLKVMNYDHYFMFFAGFAFTMHVILTAQDLQGEEKTFIKPAYFFMMVIVFTLFLCVVVLLFDLVFKVFMFPEFFQGVKDQAIEIYSIVGRLFCFFRHYADT